MDDQKPLSVDNALRELRQMDELDREWAEARGLQCECITCQLDWRERYGEDS